MQRNSNNLILGGGISGLTVGLVSGWPVFEASDLPGGICSSYYICPGSTKRLYEAPGNGEAYRFEIGGGHWIFKAEDDVLKFITKFAHLRKYSRLSAVYFVKQGLCVPYPLQNNLCFLNQNIVAQAQKELSTIFRSHPSTMKQWLAVKFGPTLCKLFFYPFHDLYTARLYHKIAPQDTYKSPIGSKSVGYNANFVYPEEGLDKMVKRMAKECNIRYGKCAVKINVKEKVVYFSDGSKFGYNKLISTLPLNKIMELTKLKVNVKTDPYTSVLVLNIGARKGKNFSQEHWLYNPESKSGFHRVGYYSNVDNSFLPKSLRKTGEYVGIYVEKAFKGGQKPSLQQIKEYSDSVVKELKAWGFIQDVDVLDSTWIDVAYTWSWPSSSWKDEAIALLNKHQIYALGRYGRWRFQGIAESIKEGLSWKHT